MITVRIKDHAYLKYVSINNGSRTEWSPIRSDRVAGDRFV